MSDNQKERQLFLTLLQQLQLTEDVYMSFFEQGELTRVTVHKKNRIWSFSIKLSNILPFKLYQLFITRMAEQFANIAQTNISIETRNPEVSEQLITDYWLTAVNQIDQMSPTLKERLISQIPKWTGTKLVVDCVLEVEQLTLKSKYADKLTKAYMNLGFPQFTIDFQMSDLTDEMRIAQEEYVQQRQLEEAELARQAMEDFQSRESNKSEKSTTAVHEGPFHLGSQIKEQEITEIRRIQEEERSVVIEGYVFAVDIKELKSGRSLLELKMTDYTDSMLVKMFSRNDEDAEMMKLLKKGMWVKVRGAVQNDTFVRDLVIMAQGIHEIHKESRKDTAPENEKRVELHLHTPMSTMDAVTSIDSLVAQAAKWGHPAIAITDHAVAQGFPEAYSAGKKHGIKIIYGLEANLVDDGAPIAYAEQHIELDSATYVVFDVETTGLSTAYDTIIELAAVKIKEGKVIDKFERFANPHRPLTPKIIELTHITDDMLTNAPEVDQVVSEFREFIGDAIVVAHNASFDIGFLYTAYAKAGIQGVVHPVIDTLELSRMLNPTLKSHRLNTLSKRYGIELTQHHRAIYDTEATGELMLHLLKEAKEKGIEYHDDFNKHVGGNDSYKTARPYHCTILAVDNEGLKNMFKLISIAHTQTYHRVPRIRRSDLTKLRKGLIVGSGCSNGELFETMMNKSPEEAEKVAGFYDYIEVHPKPVYSQLIDGGVVHDEWNLEDIIRKLVKLGKKLDKPVVATGNVHYLHENDHIFREILVSSQGGANPLNRHKLPKVHFRTTNEMLEEFDFLGPDLAKEIVVTNSRKIADMVGEVVPIKDKLYTPNIEGSNETITNMTYEMAHKIYGETLPEIVEKRIEKELDSILGHGFGVVYLISAQLVKKSLSDGYLVGSRGSVGSSFVATMMEITEVNPLPPHYICPKCHYNEFFTDGSVGSGFDLPNKECPECGTSLKKDGHDIPFETFLGFNGDKVPDIDLNFSGEYQAHAHNYTKELFGEDYVYRAGTIGTVAEKTAYGYVKGYATDHNKTFRGAEVDRLVQGCTGVKRTTGQHPGGILVVPDYMDIYDFTPVQYPADAQDSEWKTTHFDFHSIHDNILKLDILGHDDPTVLRMLQDLTGIDPKAIPTDDPEVMKIFSNTESLGVTEEQIMCKTGTLGIPEFGTKFVRQMLEETKPTTFSELLQISGLSHGTDVWLGNAQELIHNGTCVLAEVIGCRDDIMVYLIYQGLEPGLAFKIMESVRKGKGLTEDMEKAMRAENVPNWYIDSCKKIKYMFPKAHATAYVLNAVRIAWFKVHHPLVYYATYFTVRASDFDLIVMSQGSSMIRAKIEEIVAKGLDASKKEKDLQTVLEIALEMCERGMSIKKVDLYRSQASEWVIDGNSLIPPFDAIPGLGTNVAKAIVAARGDGEFLSKEDLQQRGRVSKTLIEYMDQLGCLEGLPDANQLSLF
ncbi:DNA polymerase III PolC [Ureibacillus massiliensis 4400831 = CIP 108448 = CCUG 49529]|uniref:DNA polymerase III PolC-type n=2 Tax=cellular organisms TaxID=131567 RepID=A0A0A3J527_9BACL|nr:PolC-type DNA polymerase III [Ureibacillus massiliensis]KGR92041.1 DNA polymerase III PolC [Ureibacillus massiliensis 4400831 = CIP 108448 = CCUG 49529]